jgi:hypothetical protein
MWCWRRMEKISWTDHVRKDEVLLRAAFLKLISSGNHFYQSECSTDHPNLVPFESKFIIFLNVLSIC